MASCSQQLVVSKGQVLAVPFAPRVLRLQVRHLLLVAHPGHLVERLRLLRADEVALLGLRLLQHLVYLTILWFIYTPEDIVATHAFGLTLYI